MKLTIEVAESEEWVRGQLSQLLRASDLYPTPLEGFVSWNDFGLIRPKSILGWDAVECRGRFISQNGRTLLEANAEYRTLPLLPTCALLLGCLGVALILDLIGNSSVLDHPLLALGTAGLLALPLAQALRAGSVINSRVKSCLSKHAA